MIAFLLMCVLLGAASAQMSNVPSEVMDMIALKRSQKPGKPFRCRTQRVFLARTDIAQQFKVNFAAQPFGVQGGSISIRNPDNINEVIGDYTVLITFFSLIPPFACLANGAYTFTGGDQVTFTASCSSLPIFSVTGGQGKYIGASGFVEFMITPQDPAFDGFFHDLTIC